VEADKSALQIKVDRWMSIVHGLTVSSTATGQSDPVDNNKEKIVIQNGGKSLTLVLDAEYMRYYHDSVIKEKVSKFSESDHKQYPRVTSDALLFVHKARELAYAKLGDAAGGVATRVLMILCLDSRINGMFSTQVSKDDKGLWPWERAISIFISCALTALEKVVAVEKFARSGRGKNESYAEYGYRLERMTGVYQVAELPQCADITETMRMSVPSLTLTVMEISEVLRHIIDRLQIPVPDVKSLPFFMNALKNVHGPDDTLLYQTAHEKRKRVREAAEEEEESLGQANRTKRPKFMGKAQGKGKGNGDGQNLTNDGADNANIIPVAGQNGPPFGNKTLNLNRQSHEGNHGGHRGGYRGSSRGGYRGGYQGHQGGGKS